MDRPDIGPLVRSETVSWTPTVSDIGDHILCARAEDNEGSVVNVFIFCVLGLKIMIGQL